MLSYHFEGVPRGPLGVALKNILTLGIHTKVWLYRVNREMDGHEGFHIDLRWLGVMVAFPIITPIIVKFQTARRMNQMLSHQVTMPLIRANTLGWISIVPVLGAGFFAYWVQASLNKHWFHHRREERIRLAKDRIEAIAAEAEPAPELVEKKTALEADVARLETEIAEEIEAARIRWGEERFNDRKKRADLHAAQGARMSRKELAELRAAEKRHRKAEKAAKKATRGRLFGLLPPKTTTSVEDGGKTAGPDPDDDADWQPRTSLPERMPEEIRASIEAEDREPTKEEAAEIKAAEKLVAKRQKEEEKLEKQRAKLRETLEKQRAKQEKAAEKERLKSEKAEAKAKSKPKKDKGKENAKDKAKGKKAKKPKGKGTAEPEKIPVEVKPRTLRAPPVVHEAGEGPLRTLTVTCPRCRTEIVGIKKRGDAPAKITCPTCQLVGKV